MQKIKKPDCPIVSTLCNKGAEFEPLWLNSV